MATGDDQDNDATSVYEAEEKIDFSKYTSHMSFEEQEKLNRFLSHCAESTNKPIELVKREARSRMDDFMNAFKKWQEKQALQ